MTTSLYDLTVPALVRGLENVSAFLEKGRLHAIEHGLDLDQVLQTRLYEDMAHLASQVQRACDAAKLAVKRLSQTEAPVNDDSEKTFEELQARIAATIAYLRSVPREAIDGREDAEIVLPLPNTELRFTGIGYATSFVLPNFYFHVTVAYTILRHLGVPVGKRDYLGKIQ